MLIPYRGETFVAEAVYRKSAATAESIVAQAVCSVESLATRIPAGRRPCIEATQTPINPTARQTSTSEKPVSRAVMFPGVFMAVLGFVVCQERSGRNDFTMPLTAST